jgi:hypothetical protein
VDGKEGNGLGYQIDETERAMDKRLSLGPNGHVVIMDQAV